MSSSIPDAFVLFCAYHLGVDPSGRRVGHLNRHGAARLLSRTPDEIDEALVAHGMDAARMLDLDFDLAAARFDIEASPPGVDLLAIARMHWELFLTAEERPRDWAAEAEDDARANRAVFGEGTDDARPPNKR